MKSLRKKSHRATLTDNNNHTWLVDERPQDREIRRLRGLSGEVGAACSAWLKQRGIKIKSWGIFDPVGPRGKRMKLDA